MAQKVKIHPVELGWGSSSQAYGHANSGDLEPVGGEAVGSAGHREGKEKYRTRGAEKQTVKDRKEGGRKVVGRVKYRERETSS